MGVRRRCGAFPYSVSVFPLTVAVLWERWIRRSTASTAYRAPTRKLYLPTQDSKEPELCGAPQAGNHRGVGSAAGSAYDSQHNAVLYIILFMESFP